jgi:hypothetical protein
MQIFEGVINANHYFDKEPHLILNIFNNTVGPKQKTIFESEYNSSHLQLTSKCLTIDCLRFLQLNFFFLQWISPLDLISDHYT